MNGVSRNVYVDEFKDEYSELVLGNGGSWCRDDSALGKKFSIERKKVKGKINYIKLTGNKPYQFQNKTISKEVKNQIKSEKCLVLHISKVEIDHKDGRYPPIDNTLRHFQPLSKAVNNAKRTHCSNCINTGKRFDARKLGYKKAVTEGSLKYKKTCVGCYWFDPFSFNRESSI